MLCNKCGDSIVDKSVLLCRIHKLAVFKVVCTNSILRIRVAL